jgi:hypothetical protein
MEARVAERWQLHVGSQLPGEWRESPGGRGVLGREDGAEEVDFAGGASRLGYATSLVALWLGVAVRSVRFGRNKRRDMPAVGDASAVHENRRAGPPPTTGRGRDE